MFRNLFGARLPRLALHTLLLALPFAAILAEPALAQNLDPLENMLQTVVDALTGPIGRLTVYAQASAIRAMHAALGDPWQIEPRATIVGAFLAAIASRLIESRRVR